MRKLFRLLKSAPTSELEQISSELEALLKEPHIVQARTALTTLAERALEMNNVWSGSWLGYHSTVYYRNFEPPAPGDNFSVEWGLSSHFGQVRQTGWRQLQPQRVEDEIFRRAGNLNMALLKSASEQTMDAFDQSRNRILSILHAIDRSKDDFLVDLLKQTKELACLTVNEVVRSVQPGGQTITRDYTALSQGNQLPPHLRLYAEAIELKSPIEGCILVKRLAENAAGHLKRITESSMRAVPHGRYVFIGHGRSGAWKDLRDFLRDNLKLEWEEFSRVPTAGIATKERLSQMLEDAGMAFIVMTGEDERRDGKMLARMNVVHEAGLFQGRLGFTKAIILLEEDCEEFSNIAGLGQIRFPKGNIMAVSEEIRRVLEREGMLSRTK